MSFSAVERARLEAAGFNVTDRERRSGKARSAIAAPRLAAQARSSRECSAASEVRCHHVDSRPRVILVVPGRCDEHPEGVVSRRGSAWRRHEGAGPRSRHIVSAAQVGESLIAHRRERDGQAIIRWARRQIQAFDTDKQKSGVCGMYREYHRGQRRHKGEDPYRTFHLRLPVMITALHKVPRPKVARPCPRPRRLNRNKMFQFPAARPAVCPWDRNVPRRSSRFRGRRSTWLITKLYFRNPPGFLAGLFVF